MIVKDEFTTRFQIGDKAMLCGLEVMVLDVEVTYECPVRIELGTMRCSDNGSYQRDCENMYTIKLSEGYKVLCGIISSKTLVMWIDNYKVAHKEWIATQCLETFVKD
jgi:hypothetical protein